MNFSGLFAINVNTGELRTAKALTGKGRTEPYSLTLRAQDGGRPSLFTDISLKLVIGDVVSNDGIPTFVHPKLDEMAYISEVCLYFNLVIPLMFIILKRKKIINAQLKIVGKISCLHENLLARWSQFCSQIKCLIWNWKKRESISLKFLSMKFVFSKSKNKVLIQNIGA